MEHYFIILKCIVKHDGIWKIQFIIAVKDLGYIIEPPGENPGLIEFDEKVIKFKNYKNIRFVYISNKGFPDELMSLIDKTYTGPTRPFLKKKKPEIMMDEKKKIIITPKIISSGKKSGRNRAGKGARINK